MSKEQLLCRIVGTLRTIITVGTGGRAWLGHMPYGLPVRAYKHIIYIGIHECKSNIERF